jgi:hypothetical protein
MQAMDEAGVAKVPTVHSSTAYGYDEGIDPMAPDAVKTFDGSLAAAAVCGCSPGTAPCLTGRLGC